MAVIDYGSPNAFFVFVVGHCEEWPENRVEQGDIALRNEYLAAGVPEDQIVHVKDGYCSKSNCEQELKKFLSNTRPGTTLAFYYGGHGKPSGFETLEEQWRYEDVCNTIDALFQGDRVLHLLDCCASGNLCHWIPRDTDKKYVCLANTAPYVRASDEGEEWILNNSWIQGMRRNAPLDTILEYIADRNALLVGDQFYCFVSPGVDCQGVDWTPRHQKRLKGSLHWTKLQNHIPKEAQVTSNKSLLDEPIFYKYPGGNICYNSISIYIPPCWLSGYIVGFVADGEVKGKLRLEVEYSYGSQAHLKWIVEASQSQLINHFHMGQVWMLPEHFGRAQVQLAKGFKYLDYSLAPLTMVEIATTNNTEGTGAQAIQKGTVMDWRDYDWEKLHETTRPQAPFGGYVPVRWNNTHQASLVSTKHIQDLEPKPFLESVGDILTDQKKRHWKRQALIRSMESSGKSICNAQTQMGSMKLQAYWPEDGNWYDVEPLDPATLSLKILATHAQFTLTGMYCPLFYEDGECHLSPLHFVRQRKEGCNLSSSCVVS